MTRGAGYAMGTLSGSARPANRTSGLLWSSDELISGWVGWRPTAA